MKRVLVTGGAGFIGSHTTVELHGAGYVPVIIDNFSNSKKSVIKKIEEITKSQLVWYEHDYRDAGFLEDIMTKERIDAVIHFAALKSVSQSVKDPLKYYDNNVRGLIQLLSAMQRTSVNNLVFSSSCTVYGEPDKLPLTEESDLKPATSPYGATKQMCEDIISDIAKANSHFKAVALRYFNPIGAHPSAKIGELPLGEPSNLVPYLTQAATGVRRQLTVFGGDYDTPDGTCIRDYIHVVDLARAHISALRYVDSKPSKNYGIFNIGTGKGYSVQEVIDSFISSCGVDVPYKIGPRRAGDVVKNYADVSKAKSVLKWEATHSLGDALKDAWRWQQSIAEK